MNGSRGLVLWIAGGLGVILLYAAYKGKSPTSIFTAAITGQKQSAGLSLAETGIAATTSSAVAPAPGVPSTPVLTAAVQNVNGLNYSTDQYGNPVALLPGAYQTNPNTYIPPNQVA